MKNDFNVQKLIDRGFIEGELEYERALIANRKLRILEKESTRAKSLRAGLQSIILAYEAKQWSPEAAHAKSEVEWREADQAQRIAELEREFLQKRKALIKLRLKECGLKQNDLMIILGHKSKSYMSELINGLVPFTLQDLVVVHKVLKIDLVDLVPTILSLKQRNRLGTTLEEMNHKNLHLDSELEGLV